MKERFDAVLFDCDGVLVDSEGITNGVLRDMLQELGWALSPQECMRIFVGKAVKDEAALIAANTGSPLTEDWMVQFRERILFILASFVKRRRGRLDEGTAPLPRSLVIEKVKRAVSRHRAADGSPPLTALIRDAGEACRGERRLCLNPARPEKADDFSMESVRT